MIIRSLSFEGFRNLKNGKIEPCEGVNVIYGENAQGKTNLIEALWMLTGNKSFRGAKDSELIAIGKDHAKLTAEFFAADREQKLSIIYLKGKKEVILNDVKQKGTSSLLGNICAVVFSPEHLSLVKDGPSERRRFIDDALCQIKPSYKDSLVKYAKILNQRNTLLKDIPKNKRLEDTLDAWDQRLAAVAAAMISARIRYIRKLNECADMYHNGISSQKEKLELTYKCTVQQAENMTSEQIRDFIVDYLKSNRANDILAGITSIGPHRDDVEIKINGTSVRSFGSQGQQRSCVLSMKIAEEEILELSISEKPIVFLDDVLSELDSSRQEFLLNEIDERQVFITCCEAASVERLNNGKLFRVENGQIESQII